jgi:predicted TIM-barrel fold metal-dependent hydrolase
MFGSDFPYFDPPAELAFVRHALKGTNEEDAVLGGNAAALFGLA